MKCNNCGLELNTQICPFCGHDSSSLPDSDYSELFKEEKIDIKFNMRNILNDVDYKNEFENIQVKEAELSKQYLEKDLSQDNIEKVKEINSYYKKSLEIYKTKQKKNLELFDITMLQSHVASFNDIVNNCNKFKKMVDDKILKNELESTIKSYNKEIHYIKKYFILPLYDTPGLLNRSKIVKLLLEVLSVAFLYSLFLYTGLVDLVGKPINYFTEHWGPVTPESKALAIDYCLSILGGIYLSEVLFQVFINITIKNNNFQVDKGKKYEIHLAVCLIGLVLSCLRPAFFIGYTIAFFGYILFKTLKCIFVKKWNIESIIEKCVIGFTAIYMLIHSTSNIVQEALATTSTYSSIIITTLGILLIPILFGIVFFVFLIVVNWKLYKKLDLPGWTSLIPIYSTVKFYEKVFGKWSKCLLLLIPVFNIIYIIYTQIMLCKRFGKSNGFIVGFLLLPLIFYPILAFDKSKFR